MRTKKAHFLFGDFGLSFFPRSAFSCNIFIFLFIFFFQLSFFHALRIPVVCGVNASRLARPDASALPTPAAPALLAVGVNMILTVMAMPPKWEKIINLVFKTAPVVIVILIFTLVMRIRGQAVLFQVPPQP